MPAPPSALNSITRRDRRIDDGDRAAAAGTADGEHDDEEPTVAERGEAATRSQPRAAGACVASVRLGHRHARAASSTPPLARPMRHGAPDKYASSSAHDRRAAAVLVLDMGADDRLEALVGLEAERARALRLERRRPAGDDLLRSTGSGSRRMSFTALSPATLRSASICSPTVAATPGMVRQRRGPICDEVHLRRVQEEADGRARARVPVAHGVGDRQHAPPRPSAARG